MKYLLLLTLFSVPSLQAKSVHDFTKVLNDEIRKDIQKDEEKYRKERMRGPASVEETEHALAEEPPKFDKDDRQIGPNQW